MDCYTEVILIFIKGVHHNAQPPQERAYPNLLFINDVVLLELSDVIMVGAGGDWATLLSLLPPQLGPRQTVESG